MKTFHLNLEKKWFDMILSGEKKEEYRDVSDFWKPRFKKAKADGRLRAITFSNGYQPSRRQMVIKVKYVSIREGVTEWGAEPGKLYFVIHLGEIISTKNCS